MFPLGVTSSPSAETKLTILFQRYVRHYRVFVMTALPDMAISRFFLILLFSIVGRWGREGTSPYSMTPPPCCTMIVRGLSPLLLWTPSSTPVERRAEIHSLAWGFAGTAVRRGRKDMIAARSTTRLDRLALVEMVVGRVSSQSI